MHFEQLISSENIAHDVEAASKKRVLERLSELIADHSGKLAASEVFDSLVARERLGSTGVGHGVAIPHGRLKDNERTIAAFVKLKHAIDFDAIDSEPVDLLFALLVPEHSTEEHLTMLSELAEMFNDDEFRDKLRGAGNSSELLRLLSHWRELE